jgi:predicted secreted Zn-dependent protease
MNSNFILVRLVVLTSFFSVMPITLHAETSVTKQISYYTIEGKTAEDLDQALALKGPRATTSGMGHPGITKINFGGDVTFVSTDKTCKIDKINVTLSTEIELPRWKNRRRADADLALSWDVLSSDIKRHEERHAEIAKQYAQKLDEALGTIGTRKTCEALQKKVSAITQKIMSEHDADQTRFDVTEARNFNDRLERMIRQKQQIAAE